jgi:hypothetical protein
MKSGQPVAGDGVEGRWGLERKKLKATQHHILPDKETGDLKAKRLGGKG